MSGRSVYKVTRLNRTALVKWDLTRQKSGLGAASTGMMTLGALRLVPRWGKNRKAKEKESPSDARTCGGAVVQRLARCTGSDGEGHARNHLIFEKFDPIMIENEKRRH